MRPPVLRYVLLIFSFGICLVAQGKSDAIKTEVWNGTFSYQTSGSGSEGDTSWSYQGVAKGSFVLDTFKQVQDRYVGTLDATLSYHSRKTSRSGDCVDEEEFNAEGVPINTHKTVNDAELLLHDGGWQLRVGRSTVHGTLVVRHVCNGAVTRSQTLDTIADIPYDSPSLSYPSSGTVLSGTFTVDDIVRGVTPPQGSQLATWHGEIQAMPQGDLILEVDSPSYRDWRPSAVLTAGGGVGPGDPIEFTATVKSASGKPSAVEVDRMEWELIDTSREPGVAINVPVNGDNSLDLRFDPLPGQFPSDADKQHITSAKVEHATDRARIVPLDWGAWSVLKVTAHVHGGLTLHGRFKGSSEFDVRLPKRDANSLIADSWKKEYDATGADNADDDDVPVGDGYNGDGLTLYEEYRGFYEAGVHHSGNPKQKDFFVRNEAGTIGESGARFFEAASGLAVHLLSATEFDSASRVSSTGITRGRRTSSISTA